MEKIKNAIMMKRSNKAQSIINDLEIENPTAYNHLYDLLKSEEINTIGVVELYDKCGGNLEQFAEKLKNKDELKNLLSYHKDITLSWNIEYEYKGERMTESRDTNDIKSLLLDLGDSFRSANMVIKLYDSENGTYIERFKSNDYLTKQEVTEALKEDRTKHIINALNGIGFKKVDEEKGRTRIEYGA